MHTCCVLFLSCPCQLLISLDERHDVLSTHPFLDDFIQVDNGLAVRVGVEAFLDFLPLNTTGLEVKQKRLTIDRLCKCFFSAMINTHAASGKQRSRKTNTDNVRVCPEE